MKNNLSSIRIALVHDCLREYGGAERVVEVLHELFPSAPVYTSFIDKKGLGIHANKFASWDIRTSWVQHIPLISSFISPLRFLIPLIWKSFDMSGYDVVITSSGWFMSRGIQVQKPTVHICYMHHPPRNMYGYATGSSLQKYWIVRTYASIINFFLRKYDFAAAQSVDVMIANSKETARRIEKFYRRESIVIYPPINTQIKNVSRTLPSEALAKEGPVSPNYYLSVSRLHWSKQVNLAIEACGTLKLPLVVVGTGKDDVQLKKLAGDTVTFMGSVSDEKLNELYSGAKALIFSALDEDFGMVPVEAMAHGVPVIGLAQGGVKETVIEGVTGVLFDTPSVESLTKAIQKFEKYPEKKKWDRECKAWAKQFDTEVFKEKILALVTSSLK